MNDQSVRSIRKVYRPELSVLVVEDYMLFGKDVKHALPQHTIVFAGTVEDAKSCYDERLPDITFLDIDLPDGSGFEVLDYIRAREPDAYVIMLTGSKLQADIALSQEKGAHGYITKPFTRAKIEEATEKYLNLREQHMKTLLEKTENNRKNNISNEALGNHMDN